MPSQLTMPSSIRLQQFHFSYFSSLSFCGLLEPVFQPAHLVLPAIFYSVKALVHHAELFQHDGYVRDLVNDGIRCRWLFVHTCPPHFTNRLNKLAHFFDGYIFLSSLAICKDSLFKYFFHWFSSSHIFYASAHRNERIYANHRRKRQARMTGSHHHDKRIFVNFGAVMHDNSIRFAPARFHTHALPFFQVNRRFKKIITESIVGFMPYKYNVRHFFVSFFVIFLTITSNSISSAVNISENSESSTHLAIQSKTRSADFISA
nr:MAG TPA: hypothetical protein [Caudoviricetes sp.]